MSSKVKFTKLILIIAICILLVFLNSKIISGPIHAVFFNLAYPFQKAFYISGTKIKDTADFLGSISRLKEENEKLIKENNEFLAQIANLKDQQNENAELRRQLDLAPRGKYNLEAALVIGQNPANLGSWLIIGKGQADGIETNMPAIAYDGILIGKVSEVYRDSSKILLLTDPESAVNAEDLQTHAAGILKGEYNLGLIMDMVEQSDTLNKGDDIITSGLGGFVPRGLLIGKIQQLGENQDKLFQQAAVIPVIKYSKLKAIFVIKN